MSDSHVRLPTNFPSPFPALWADEWFEDEFGLGMVLAVGEARQTFRRIKPGRFDMGSIKNSEAGRRDDETRHSVALTSGFWLADTACTQAFWQAVMRTNPSKFQDDQENPVERVSWNDVQDFLTELNSQVEGLAARLTTEAEWEFACRAGTNTPFSFGGNVTPEQVNYDGSHPYHRGSKGLNRRRTVPVKNLPPNGWGLYQMHGNVWEWCADWYGSYDVGFANDPVGPFDGIGRVARGGSWKSYGSYVRSASRLMSELTARHETIGFRLALGQAELRLGEAAAAGRAVGAESGSQDRGGRR